MQELTERVRKVAEEIRKIGEKLEKSPEHLYKITRNMVNNSKFKDFQQNIIKIYLSF
jgi:DNA-binding ferritin-like protein